MSKKKKKQYKPQSPSPQKPQSIPIKQIIENNTTSEQPNTKYHKRPSNKEIVEALIATKNNKTKAAELLHVDRKSLKTWLNEDKELQEELKDVQEEILEWVIDKEFELIEGVWTENPKYVDEDGYPFVYKAQPCWRMIQHYVDAQGKNLGFGKESTNIKINNSLTNNQNKKQRVILEVPRNGRNTATNEPT